MQGHKASGLLLRRDRQINAHDLSILSKREKKIAKDEKGEKEREPSLVLMKNLPPYAEQQS